MTNNNDSCRDDKSQDLRIVYKITHALEMFVELDPLNGWYSLKSLCIDGSIDRSRSVELYSDLHLRLNIFFYIDDLLYTLLHSEAIFIPIKDGLDGSFCTRKIANPFYGLSKEAAAIKADFSMICQQMAEKESGKMALFEDMLFDCVFKDVSMNPTSTLECNTRNCLLEISLSIHLRYREQSTRNMLLCVLPQGPCAID